MSNPESRPRVLSFVLPTEGSGQQSVGFPSLLHLKDILLARAPVTAEPRWMGAEYRGLAGPDQGRLCQLWGCSQGGMVMDKGHRQCFRDLSEGELGMTGPCFVQAM